MDVGAGRNLGQLAELLAASRKKDCCYKEKEVCGP